MPIQGSTSLTAPKFSRRQSYDVLSTTKAPLSLGPLPLPNFSEIPNGQRSVPVSTTSTPRLTSGGVASHRNVFGPSSAGIIEAPRTPGGSLVIGSEVFGFGRQQSNLLGKERWGSGTLDGESTLEGEEGFDQQTPKGGETDNIKWSNDYTGGVNGGVANGGGDFQLDHSNNEFNVETSNPVSFFSFFSYRPSLFLGLPFDLNFRSVMTGHYLIYFPFKNDANFLPQFTILAFSFSSSSPSPYLSSTPQY